MGVGVLLSPLAIQIVLVLYQTTWENVPSRAVLTQFMQEHPESQLLLYDNSPTAQTHPFFAQPNLHYVHDPSNQGLAVAYNQGLQAAQAHQLAWLLLLDDDTVLTPEYFHAVQATQVAPSEVVCFVPQMLADQRQISPLVVNQYIDRHWTYPAVGISTQRLMAINSASVWRVAFLVELQGFTLQFPLDFLDHWLSYQVYQHKKVMAVLPVTLQHDLSVLHYQTMSLTRYQSILQAENRYYTTVEPELSDRHQTQLKKRTLKQFFTVKNRKIWRATWQNYCQMRKDES